MLLRSRRSRRNMKKSRKRRNVSKNSPLKLIKIGKSPKVGKKLSLFFTGKYTNFNAIEYSDYTKHKDKTQMKRYLSRHRKHESLNNITSLGALSRWVLWNKPSFKASVSDYKKRLVKSRRRSK